MLLAILPDDHHKRQCRQSTKAIKVKKTFSGLGLRYAVNKQYNRRNFAVNNMYIRRIIVFE